jgi:hypothetical protein
MAHRYYEYQLPLPSRDRCGQAMDESGHHADRNSMMLTIRRPISGYEVNIVMLA